MNIRATAEGGEMASLHLARCRPRARAKPRSKASQVDLSARSRAAGIRAAALLGIANHG